jgi:hypothetical protein
LRQPADDEIRGTSGHEQYSPAVAAYQPKPPARIQHDGGFDSQPVIAELQPRRETPKQSLSGPEQAENPHEDESHKQNGGTVEDHGTAFLPGGETTVSA